MTDCELIQMLADGYTVKEIFKEKGINNRTLEKRILILRKRCDAKTVTQLVVKYFKLGLVS